MLVTPLVVVQDHVPELQVHLTKAIEAARKATAAEDPSEKADLWDLSRAAADSALATNPSSGQAQFLKGNAIAAKVLSVHFSRRLECAARVDILADCRNRHACRSGEVRHAQ